MMLRSISVCFVILIIALGLNAQTYKWTVSNGLPTNEVRQIVELPNGQMLVGCEGQYCLTVGETFVPVACDRRSAVRLKHFSIRYGHLWQGDSLLWLHDLYRLYLFDARTRTFRIADSATPFLPKDFADGKTDMDFVSDELWLSIDSLGLHDQCMTATRDRQGGLWIGTRDEGIVYLPPRRKRPMTMHDDRLMQLVRSHQNSKGTVPSELPYRRINFTCDLKDGRVLIAHDFNRLAYFLPSENKLAPIENASLQSYRNIVGAVPLDSQWTIIYTQNGAFMLDIKADTLAAFPSAMKIESYTDKYNCMLRDIEDNLWVGTQNGLFLIKKGRVKAGNSCQRIENLANNCIRSLVMDAEGRVWAGTSCGISRITPSVINLNASDGIPEVSMMERAAMLLADSTLVFAHGSQCTLFRPEWLTACGSSLPVRILTINVNGRDRVFRDDQPLSLPYNENYLTLLFSTLDYANTVHTRYRYRLKGLEQEWHEVEQTHGYAKAEYTALPSGNYIFEVQAASNDGLWGETTSQLVNIRPPFWLTWWAYLSYGLIVIIFLWKMLDLYLRRKRMALERENEIRVNQLFELREEARHQFAENANIDPTKIGINPEEEALVDALLKAIEKHIQDCEYGVEQLAADVSMSRSKLYDKMRNMLGITPADFMRNVRLKRAAQLLSDNPSLSVNEVSTRVGFGTARNFSTQFKKMFGVLPSEYK